MADEQQQTPVFQIQRVYLKDLSLEQPNSPSILLQQESPAEFGIDRRHRLDGRPLHRTSLQCGGLHALHGAAHVGVAEEDRDLLPLVGAAENALAFALCAEGIGDRAAAVVLPDGVGGRAGLVSGHGASEWRLPG